MWVYLGISEVGSILEVRDIMIQQYQHFMEIDLEQYFKVSNFYYQSGSKPSLVANILATKFGFVPDWLHANIYRMINYNTETLYQIANSDNSIHILIC